MSVRLFNVGYGSFCAAERVLTVTGADAAPLRRLVQEARDAGRVIDATGGHRTRAVLLLDTGHVLLSALTPETLAGRASETPAGLPPTIRRPGDTASGEGGTT